MQCEIKPRTLFLLLGGVLLYLALGAYLLSTAPGAAKSVRRPVTLTLAVPPGVLTDPIYRQAIARFEEKHPECGVTLLPLSGSGNFYQKLMVMIVGNTAPDLMWMGQSFNEFADRGVFLDLTSRIRDAKLDPAEYRPEMLEWYTRDGKLYSLPFGIDLSFLIYNRKLFREAGVPDPGAGWSFDEFLAAARRLTKRDENGGTVRYGFRGPLEPGIFGAAAIDPATKQVACDSPEMLECLRTNLDLSFRWKVSPPPEEATEADSRVLGLFRQERVAMMRLSTVTLTAALELFSGMEIGVALQPAVKKRSQWASSQAVCIYAGTKHPDEAFELFREFQSAEFQLAMAHRMLPARRPLALRAVREAGKPYNYPLLLEAAEAMEPVARVPHLQELLAVYTRFSNAVMARRLSPEEGMRECAAEMRRRIGKFQADDAATGKE